ncbi:NAD(P)/FAD-dependent oxidoreductase [Psychrobacter urativorans]|uniref:NADP transhydrogenase subunit alpha n=1 Tax=Psychrobacter urativorans TaxID=45610 RepID=A0A0M4U512_9GAMM|nr:NAD(P)-binding protein [Psychrobacter urativorans]ALF59894.1 NADP transhydrogenase subunit alpha [Psychrobacter urativorans]
MPDYSVTNSTVNNNDIHTKNTAPKIAIIGSGLTGLFAATLLERSFGQSSAQQESKKLPQITVFEKSRSVGRLATRYRTDEHTQKNWQWAFGAQFFTAKSDNFLQFIQPWLATGLLQPWCAEVVDLIPTNDNSQLPEIKQKEQWDTIHARYISTPKMTSWGRALADELRFTTMQFKTRVAPLSGSKDALDHNTEQQTELFDEHGSSLGSFDWVICTAPNGQAVELMANSGFTQQAQISQPTMQACYTLMLGWDNIEQLPETLKNNAQPKWDVAYINSPILDRIFIEHHKPAHGELLPSITIHASNDWSEAHVDENIEVVKAQLLEATQQALHWNSDTAPSQIDCHRWRYAATIMDTNGNGNKPALGILVDNTHQWIVSGDWCGQGNIESCYQMAAHTVQVLTEALNN